MKKLALLIGVENYHEPQITPLPYATADVTALALRLRGACGFDGVTVLADGADGPPDWHAIDRAMDDLARELRPPDLLLFYLAGHGVEAGGERYVLTRDCRRAHVQRGLGLRAGGQA